MNWLGKAAVLALAAAFAASCNCGGGDEKASRFDEGSVDDDDDSPTDDDSTGGETDDDLTPPTNGPSPAWGGPRAVGSPAASTPNLRVRDAGQIDVTFVEPSENPEQAPYAYLYMAALTGETMQVGEAALVAADAHAAHWQYRDGQIDLAGSRWTQTVLVRSPDGGAAWDQIDAVLAFSGICEGKLPAVLEYAPSGQTTMAFGFDYDTNIFGCSQEVHWTRLTQDQWDEPLVLGRGVPVGLHFLEDGRIVIPATGDVYVSEDDGATFTVVPPGDYTKDQVRGEASVRRDDGSIWLITYYNWANLYYVSIVASDADVQTWKSPHLVLDESTALTLYPRLARWDRFMIAAWQEHGGRAYVRMSSDDGASWSEKTAVLADYPDAVIDDLQLAADAGVAAMALHVTNGGLLGDPGVYVLRAELE